MPTSVPILDPHVHFWDPRHTPRTVSPLVRLLGFRPDWVDWVARRAFPASAVQFVGTPRYVTRPYLPETYAADHGDLPIRGVVHVEAGWTARGTMGPVGETRWVEARANGSSGPPVRALVGHADLALGRRVGPVLDAHGGASGRLRGVRDSLAWDGDTGVLDFADGPGRAHRRDFRQGVEQLLERGLRFDAWCYHPQIDDVRALAAAYPELPIVLCHMGTPIGVGGPFASYGRDAAQRDRIRKDWAERLAALAQHSNVWLKISGLGMPVLGFGFEHRSAPPGLAEMVDAWGPLVEVGLTTFGPGRCMFASNFPIDKPSLPLSQVWAVFQQLSQGMDERERRGLFETNAAGFYDVQG